MHAYQKMLGLRFVRLFAEKLTGLLDSTASVHQQDFEAKAGP